MSHESVRKCIKKLVICGVLVPENGGFRFEKDHHKWGVSTPVDSQKCQLQLTKVSTPVDSALHILKKIKERTLFKKPTPEEVTQYAKTIHFDLNGEVFCDFYEAKGWVIGKERMKSWKAAVRTWKHRQPKETPSQKLKSLSEIS